MSNTAFERDGAEAPLLNFTTMASASLAKDKRVNIRISSRDLNDLQAKAAEEAIPY